MIPAVGLSALADLFPFHIAADLDLTIVAIGPSLPRICPSITPGQKLADAIRFVRPPVRFELEMLRRKQRSVVLVEARAESIALRGQIVVDEARGVVLLAVAPRVIEARELESVGLTVHDFAPSDPMLDFLLLLQTKEAILTDALALNENLERQRHELEEARAELLAEIDDRRRAEEALREANAELSEKLATIAEQAEAIEKMSVPVLHVWDGVVALPIVGALDEARVQKLGNALLGTAARADVRTVIVDLTGVDEVIGDAALRLVGAARAAALLGRRCSFTGVSAVLSRALVEAGVDLERLVFLPNVRAAITRALQTAAPANDGGSPRPRSAR